MSAGGIVMDEFDVFTFILLALAMALAQVDTAVRCKVWGRRCRVYLDTVETVDMVSTCTVWEDQKERKQDESDCDFAG